ncbi:hypothetical protein MLD38_010517 [Melastoma candidum]|uniref:Uncharacterized protein n=1 Tax=Melastoma candidum TaxID=119954 RepID=A0ACB9R047_9MYRT|nr:hypothetical protein MLD38_010517 [Melastoma candidum]
MHSWGYRLNAVATFSLTVLGFMCGMVSFFDNFSHPTPSADVRVSVTMNITANLQSLFTWNTKQVFVFLAAEYETPMNSLNQVSLWDGIIPTKEHARFWIHTANKYGFMDQQSPGQGFQPKAALARDAQDRKDVC